MENKIRVVVADDHKITIDGIKSMISSNPNIEVVGEALTGKQVLAFLEQNEADIVLMDINMPEMDGIEATREITTRWPHVKVLMLSMHHENKFVRTAIDAGAKGYMLKEGGQMECITAIQAIAVGGTYFSPGVEKAFTSQYEETQIQLSQREIEVLELIAEGFSSKEIGDKLFISENTVNHHRKNLHSKTGSTKVAELISWARENGALD